MRKKTAPPGAAADAHRRWKFGEDIQPPEMERPLGVGSDLKAKLGKRDVKRLGGAVDGEEATQASSILRKKAIANMNKEAVMARLDEMSVRFDEVQGVATLRSLLVGESPQPAPYLSCLHALLHACVLVCSRLTSRAVSTSKTP